MIIEHAILRIKPGQEADFEAAVPQAIPHLAASEGFLGVELRRSIENPSSYHLLVRWRTLEDHTVGFRESDRFPKWRAVIGGFFAAPPEVEHLAAPAVTA